MSPLIRREAAADAHAVRSVVTLAFGRTDEAALVEQLRADGDSVISLVAVDADDVVGHVLFSRMTAPFRALGLAPVSVAPHRQGKGIGGQLIGTGLTQAKQAGWQGVIVLGDPAYYGRFGFHAETAKGFTSPYAGPHLMALALDGTLPAAGKIDYAPAFAALG